MTRKELKQEHTRLMTASNLSIEVLQSAKKQEEVHPVQIIALARKAVEAQRLFLSFITQQQTELSFEPLYLLIERISLASLLLDTGGINDSLTEYQMILDSPDCPRKLAKWVIEEMERLKGLSS